jgi:hypothetical protein
VFEVQGGFKWPLFPLTPAVLCNADLMLPGEEQARFKRYNPCIHTWSKVLVGHVITLKAGEHIFLKGYDVNICYDFDRLLSASQQREPHFFTNLPRERTFIRQAMKERVERQKKIDAGALSLSSDCEEAEEDQSLTRSKITSRPLTLPPRFKTEPSDFALDFVASDSNPTSHHTATLPRHIVKPEVEPTFIDLTMSDAEDGAIPTLMDAAPMDDVTRTPPKKKRVRSFSSLSASLSTPRSDASPNETEESSDDSPPAWPAAFYVVDIVRGFEKCDEARRERRSVEKAFFKCFKVPFRSTTFYNHRRKWDNASAASRDAALRAGHTSAGLWTTFLERSRAKAVDKKGKKRVRN